MVMAVNNSALLGASAVVDPSGWANQFREGQKLRQDYEMRQQQKALNELMGIDDFNERIAKARTHKYAGALVPQLQQYEEARQKAALDNLKSSADIGKTYAETGKLGAESGKIGAETQQIGAETEGTQAKTAQSISDYISAAAVTQDPKAFGLKIGELYKRRLITPEQTQGLLGLTKSDTESAAVILQRLAMGNPEIAKVFTPQAKTLDAGDAVYQYTVNPFTGQASDPTAKIAKGVSPDAKLTNQTSAENNIRTTNATMYSSDNAYEASVYKTDKDAASNAEQLAVDWFVATNKANVDATNAETNQIKARAGTTGVNGQPVRKLDANEKKQVMKLDEEINADKSVLSTLSQMLNLVSDSYSGVGAGLRAKTMSNIGLGGTSANNTVLYDNLATSQALAQLKSTFGAAPTEGERKILMDIQASSDKTPSQKIAIIRAAVQAVKVRAAYRQSTKQGILTGQYMVPSSSTKSKPAPKSSKGQAIGKKIFGGG